MAFMPRPTKVWMVALGRAPMVEVVGDLRLEQEGLIFQPRNEEMPTTRLRFETIARVTRVRGSPVLMITHADDTAQKAQTAFYFTQPPALSHIVKSRSPQRAEDTDLRSIRPMPFGIGQRKPSKRRTVRTNATYLTQEGTNRKKELQTWVEEIRRELRRA
jgi:hypothetical protein